MLDNSNTKQPDSTAIRVALWRALHVQLDGLPHVLEDELGLQLVSPDESWKFRPDMEPQGTKGFRASIVGRARYIEDLVLRMASQGVNQYVILGAGLDTFAQRRLKEIPRLQVFEIDQPNTQSWKQKRLAELGFDFSDRLHFVPVDFEKGDLWLNKLLNANFKMDQPAVVVSTGVSMYLTQQANKTTLETITSLAPGSVMAMTFLLPLDLIDPGEREQLKFVYIKARAAGTPFVSFFSPKEILTLAREVGFSQVQHVSRSEIIDLYFLNRSDGLKPSSGEEFLIATV